MPVKVVLPTPAPPPPPASPTPLPARVRLSGIRHEYQGWNNCGPVTIGMALSYFGRTETQKVIAPLLKPDPDDKNVTLQEMAAYAQSLGFQVHMGVAGDLDLLKQLVAAGFPVIVHTWFEPEPNDGMGHFRLVVGYDDVARTFTVFDSYLGPNRTFSYETVDDFWRVFNRAYLVVYPPDRASQVNGALGEYLDPGKVWAYSLYVANAEIKQNPRNAFAWFNLGTTLLRLGNAVEAARAYDRARELGLPWRMLWYQFGPFEAYMAVGRYQDVIALADANLRRVSNLEELLYWRGRAREALGDMHGARQDYQAALRINPKLAEASAALARVPARPPA